MDELLIEAIAHDPAPDPADILDQLRALSGQRVRFQSVDCRLVDVIDEPPMVVLQRLEGQGEIEADSYGHPVGMGPGFIDVPVFDESGSLSAEFRLILLPGDAGIDESTG